MSWKSKRAKHNPGVNVRKGIIRIICLLATLAALSLAQAALAESGKAKGLEIYYFDLGRVDGILIRCDGVDSFIDVGFGKDAEPALAYLEGLGVTHLDSYICSHAHADHIEGGPRIIRELGADTIYAPHARVFEALLDYGSDAQDAAVKSAKSVIVKAGDSFTIGGATVTCYGPVSIRKCAYGAQVENENSLLLRLVYGERSFMFTGDATSGEITKAQLRYPGKLKCDVLKNPHHNGKLDEKVVKYFSPKVTIFCTDNEDQPIRAYTRLLKKLGSRVYITGSKNDGNIKLASNGKSLRITRGYPLSKVALAPVKTRLYPGRSVSLGVTIEPARYAERLEWLHWSSSNSKVAKVSSSGKLTAVGAGTATITATSINGLTASVDVKVYAYGIVLNKKALTLEPGSNAYLKYKLGPKSPGKAKIKWSSNRESVAFVTDKGEVIAVSEGTATITAKAPNGLTAKCKVKVSEIKVKKLTLNHHRLSLKAGESTKLRVKVSPENPTRKDLQWASSDKSVATVDENGRITAVGKGSCKIGVRAASGVTDVCTVRVK